MSRLQNIYPKGGKHLTELLRDLDKRDHVLGATLNDIHNTKLHGELPDRLVLALAVLSGSEVRVDSQNLQMRGAVAVGADFSGSVLRRINMSDAVATDADFSGADLRGGNFANGVFNQARFSPDTQVNGSNWTGAYLLGAEGLIPEQIKQMRITGARILRAAVDLEGSDGSALAAIMSDRFGGSADTSGKLQRETVMPVISKNDILPKLATNTVVRGGILLDLEASDCNVTDSHFTGSFLMDPNFDRSQLVGSVFSGAVIDGGSFSNADMSFVWAAGLKATNVDFSGADFSGANMAGAVFTGCDFTNVKGLDNINSVINGITFVNCRLPKGYSYDGHSLVLPRSLGISDSKSLPQ